MPEQAPAAAADDRDTRVAVLMAVAAIAAAALGAQATLLSGRASDEWHGAVRLQVRDGLTSANDAIFAFEEVPLATLSAGHLLEAHQLAATNDPFLTKVAALLRGNALVPPREAAYVRADGSFDLARREADLARRDAPTTGDVDSQLRAADRDAHRAWLVGLAILPAALAFLAAALAKAVPRARRAALPATLVLLVAAAAIELAAVVS